MRQSPYSCNGRCKMAAQCLIVRKRCHHRKWGSEQSGPPLASRSDCQNDQLAQMPQLRTKRQFESTVFRTCVQSVVIAMPHQPNGHHQAVAADFWHQLQLVI